MVAKNISVTIGKHTPGESAGVPVHLRTLTQGGWEESTTKLSEDEFPIEKEKKKCFILLC